MVVCMFVCCRCDVWCTVGTRLSRVRFTVSGCVSCGGWFGCGPSRTPVPTVMSFRVKRGILKILHCVQNDILRFWFCRFIADTAEPCPYGNAFNRFRCVGQTDGQWPPLRIIFRFRQYTIGAKRYNHKTLPCLPWKGRWQTEGLTEGFLNSTLHSSHSTL